MCAWDFCVAKKPYAITKLFKKRTAPRAADILFFFFPALMQEGINIPNVYVACLITSI